MLIAHRNGMMVRTSAQEPTLAQFLNNELEEIVIPNNFPSSTFPFFIGAWATNLKAVRQEGFPNCNDIQLYTGNQLSMPNIEIVEVRMPLLGLSSKYKLRVAKGGAIGTGDYAYFLTGRDVAKTDIYSLTDDSSSILSKITQYWQKTIVFHGNDGKKVYYNGTDWVIADDEEAGWQNT